jgi:hypothetical protein
VKPTIRDGLREFLKQFKGDTKTRYRRALVAYHSCPATVKAVRRLWLERAKNLPEKMMVTEKVALRLFLGQRLYVAMPRRSKDV